MEKRKDISDLRTDARLRQVFQSLPQAPENPWFTRRVMNRLPQRRTPLLPRLFSGLCYAAAFVAFILLAGYAVNYMLENGVTLTSLCMLAVIPVAGLLCAGVYVMPVVRRVIDGEPPLLK